MKNPSRAMLERIAATKLNMLVTNSDRWGKPTLQWAVQEGYAVVHPMHYGRKMLRRTDKPLVLPPKQPRAARKRTYNGVFPWPVAAHTERVRNGAVRTTDVIAAKLAGNTFNIYLRSMVQRERRPLRLGDESDVDKARKAVKHLFQEGYNELGRYQWLLSSAENVRLLLLELGVTPHFEGGQFMRFVALPDAECEAEYTRRTGTTVLERYHKLMEA